jgi:hypothetical protein
LTASASPSYRNSSRGGEVVLAGQKCPAFYFDARKLSLHNHVSANHLTESYHMDIFALYATDLDAEENGVWIAKGDAEFLIARSGNEKYNRMLNVQYEGNKVILDAKDTEAEQIASAALSRKINIDLMAKSILLGWRGNVTYKGAPLEYNIFSAKTILAHKDFANWVSNESSKLSNYQAKSKEVDEKNSEPTSSGTSNGEATLST